MKRFFRFVMAAAVLFGAVACSQSPVEEVVVDQEVTTKLTIGLENLGTRLAGDSGMIDKVAWGVYNHKEDGSGEFLIAHSSENDDIGVADFVNGAAEIEITLFTGKKYDLVFWGYCSSNTAYSIDWENRALNVNYADQKANVEANDAFFHIENGFRAGQNQTFTLRRPFAQLNVGQTYEDYNIMQLTGNSIVASSVVAQAYNSMSLVDGSVSGDLVDVELRQNALVADDLTVSGIDYKHLAMNYLLVNTKEVINTVTFQFLENGEAAEGNGTVFTREYYNIPLQRNYRTNILGSIISDEYTFEVIIDERFVDNHSILFLDAPVYITTTEEFHYYMSHYIVGEVNVDSNVTATTDYIRLADGTDAVINMNNAALTSGSASNYAFIVTGNAKAEINDANIHSLGGGLGISNGANVTFSGDVYVDTDSTSGRYNFYVTNNAILTILDGNFTWNTAKNTKRALVYADPTSTVYIKGGNFAKASTRSGYTEGILGGGNVIITGGVFGFNPTAWVAPGYKAVKDGSKWYVVEQDAVLVTNTENLLTAVANDKVINLGPITYEGVLDLSGVSGLTIKSTCGAKINGLVWLDNSNVVLEGLTLTNAVGAQHPNPSNSQYYNTINNQYPVIGAYLNSNVKCVNCVFDLVGPTAYGFYGYAANSPEFQGCTFNCNGIRPIASNGPSVVVNGCTFVNQYHYSVRIYENSGEVQNVVYTNNVVSGSNAKGEFEGINISKKGNTATVVGNFTIKGNTAGLKYRHHNQVTMSDACTYDTDIVSFAFAREE